jgi:hypothetical protein
MPNASVLRAILNPVPQPTEHPNGSGQRGFALPRPNRRQEATQVVACHSPASSYGQQSSQVLKQLLPRRTSILAILHKPPTGDGAKSEDVLNPAYFQNSNFDGAIVTRFEKLFLDYFV